HDFGKNIIPSIIASHRVFAYPFRNYGTQEQAYWRDVGTLDAYWEANMELVSKLPQLDLYDRDWPILTNQERAPPAKFIYDHPGRRGEAIDSMVSAGCIVSGASIQRSLIFTNCKIHSYTTISDSLLLPECEVMESCTIKNAIIDRGAIIPAGTEIGVDL